MHNMALAIAGLAFFGLSPLSAQETTPRSAAPDGAWHVVRPGDTLESIASRYLGTGGAWRHKLDYQPVTQDPNRIFPGQRIELREAVTLPPQHAKLVAVSDGVTGQFSPLEWTAAWRQDLLQPKDGLRTYGGDSALLSFGDDTNLVLTEDSVVFLRPTGPEIAPVDRTLIEIVVGQADLGAQRSPTAGDDIEIVLGPSKVRPSAGPDGTVQTRARVGEARDAQLMVYEGKSALETGGKSVAVDRGMGVAVDKSGAASPPERLLPAPQGLSPAMDSSWSIDRPPFSWDPVEGAVSYVVEVCRDPRCAELVRRVTGVETTSWRPDSLPLADLVWRVTAVSKSGLDGYPGSMAKFTIAATGQDEKPPWILARFAGNQVSVYDELIVGPGTRIEVESGDDETGVDPWKARLDGVAVAAEALDGPWPAGSHTVELRVVDGGGNESTLGPLAFTYDPMPPTVSWLNAANERLGEAQGRHADSSAAEPPFRRRPPKLLWSADDDGWAPMTRQHGLQGENVRLGLRTAKGRVRLGATDVILGPDEPLWIEATDLHARGINLTAQMVGSRPTAGGEIRPLLVVRAIDLLGNTTRLSWPLTPASRR